MFYQVYSLDEKKIIKGDWIPIISGGEYPVITAKGLFLVDMHGNRPPRRVMD